LFGMGRKTTINHTARRAPARCRHRVQHEADWLGRTYVGCPVCNRWKPVKPRAAAVDARRWAA
jgi:lipopolysaccharide biosynthesis regulator YciM